MNYHNITYPDLNNGIGLRVTLWLSGCDNKCKGCHNPQTWDKNSGTKFNDTTKKKLFDVLSKEYIEGITFSGGDPLHENNIKEVNELIGEIRTKYPQKTIWLFTGNTLENIYKEESIRKEIIEKCDVLVDGRFIEEQKDLSLAWRGSRNQRVIDIPKTLKSGKIELYTE